MNEYEISMVFFQNAGRICFAAAAAAFVIAVILFFMFDIRTVFMIRYGLARQAALPADSSPVKGADPYPVKETDSCPAKKAVPRAEGSFRIVREIILTDTEERILLKE